MFDIQNFLPDHFRSGENHRVATLISRFSSSRRIQDASPSPWRARQGEIHLFKIVVFEAQGVNVTRSGQAPPLPPHVRTVNLRLFSRLRCKFPFDKARFHARSFPMPQKPQQPLTSGCPLNTTRLFRLKESNPWKSAEIGRNRRETISSIVVFVADGPIRQLSGERPSYTTHKKRTRPILHPLVRRRPL